MAKDEYTEEEAKAIQVEMYSKLREDALDKIKRITLHLRTASEFTGVGYIEGMNFVLDDLEEVLLNWES